MDGIVRAQYHVVGVGRGSGCGNFARCGKAACSIHESHKYTPPAGEADAAKINGRSLILTKQQNLVPGIDGNGLDDAVGRFGKLLRPEMVACSVVLGNKKSLLNAGGKKECVVREVKGIPKGAGQVDIAVCVDSFGSDEGRT